MPYVIGCPEPVMEHHARLAAIEFCRRTLCLTQTLAAVEATGTAHNISLTTDIDRQPIKVKAVSVSGKEFPLVPTIQGQALTRAGGTADYAYQTDTNTLMVYPLQAAGVEVIADAAIAPTMASPDCPDDLAPYLQDIALGAIASLQMLPNQSFTNPQHAQVSQAGFNARVSTVAAKIARGQSAAKMRTRATYI